MGQGAGTYLRVLVVAGWSLLGLRLLLVLWIRKTRSAFLRKHAGCVDEASLEQTLRMIADLESPHGDDAR